jgi:ABC-2 type transport system permease protein
MKTLLKLTSSSIKMFLRNKQALFFTLFTPLIIMSVFGFLGFDRVPKIEVGYAVTAPPTEGTKAIIEQLKQVPAFDMKGGTEIEERNAIAEGERSVVFIIPHDLVPDQADNTQRQILVLTNAGEEQQAATAVGILNQFLDKTNLAINNAPILLSARTEAVNSRNLKYIDFLVPGIVALSIMQMSVFSVAFVFADYKEKGILKRLLATPMKPWQFVTSNVISRLLIAVLQAAVLIAVGVLLFKAHVLGSYFLMLLVIVLGAIMFLGLGFTISGIASTVESVPALANLVVFPMFFLGGTFFPLDIMPDWLQSIARFLPLTYFSDALRSVMIEDAGFAAIRGDLLWMLGWAVILVVLANFTFAFEEKRV